MRRLLLARLPLRRVPLLVPLAYRLPLASPAGETERPLALAVPPLLHRPSREAPRLPTGLVRPRRHRPASDADSSSLRGLRPRPLLVLVLARVRRLRPRPAMRLRRSRSLLEERTGRLDSERRASASGRYCFGDAGRLLFVLQITRE